jgi:hypothetical protein
MAQSDLIVPRKQLRIIAIERAPRGGHISWIEKAEITMLSFQQSDREICRAQAKIACPHCLTSA